MRTTAAVETFGLGRLVRVKWAVGVIVHKKTRRHYRRVGLGKMGSSRLDQRFGNLGVEFDGARVVTFDAMQLVPALQHAIEFVDEHGDRLVAFVRLDGSVHIGTEDLDVTLSRELHAHRGIAIAF